MTPDEAISSPSFELAGESETVTAVLPRTYPRCQRCGGRTIPDGDNGDAACFTCGNVIYFTTPLPIPENGRRERRPSHGGRNLS
jgi:tRNA(Ile2) C34 agmatinyltransferase TiaS